MAKAMSRPGKASKASTRRMTTESAQPRTYPTVNPVMVPMTAPANTAAKLRARAVLSP